MRINGLNDRRMSNVPVKRAMFFDFDFDPDFDLELNRLISHDGTLECVTLFSKALYIFALEGLSA
jgi:hypothetical protein